MIPHFVFMNFNAGLYQRTDLRRRTGFDKPLDWLQHRLKLARQYTVASLAAQTFKDFVLIVHVDSLTPLDQEEMIVSSLRPLRFQRLYTPHKLDMKTVPQELIDIHYPHHTGPVISTRMDNDDAVHPKFFETVQAVASKLKTTGIVDYKVGAFFDPGAKRGYVWNWGYASPFLSLCAWPNAEGKYPSCWAGQHGTMNKLFPWHVQASPEAMWMQVCHGRNLVNRIRGRVRPCSPTYIQPILNVCPDLPSGG